MSFFQDNPLNWLKLSKPGGLGNRINENQSFKSDKTPYQQLGKNWIMARKLMGTSNKTQ